MCFVKEEVLFFEGEEMKEDVARPRTSIEVESSSSRPSCSLQIGSEAAEGFCVRLGAKFRVSCDSDRRISLPPIRSQLRFAAD
jgi:hypothetical protein